MQKIALVTDSSCDLDRATLERYGIHVIPLSVLFGAVQYRDGVDITPQEVYSRMVDEPASTSLPSPQSVSEALTKLTDEGFTHVLAIHLSSALSGTFDMVRMMCRDVRNMVIEVIDSRGVSMMLGLIVRQAAAWIEEKVEFCEVVARVHNLIPKVRGYFTIKTLEYLKRGGRMSFAAATVGDLLDIKPVITVDPTGRLVPFAKIRGRARSLEHLYEIARDAAKGGRLITAVLQGDAKEEATILMDRIRCLPNIVRTTLHHISPALVVHAGPGLVGVILMPAE